MDTNTTLLPVATASTLLADGTTRVAVRFGGATGFAYLRDGKVALNRPWIEGDIVQAIAALADDDKIAAAQAAVVNGAIAFCAVTRGFELEGE